MPSNISRLKNEALVSNRCLDPACDDINQRFMRVRVQRRLRSRLIVKFEHSHLLAFQQRLDYETSVHGLALDRADYEAWDVCVLRDQHGPFPGVGVGRPLGRGPHAESAEGDDSDGSSHLTGTLVNA